MRQSPEYYLCFAVPVNIDMTGIAETVHLQMTFDALHSAGVSFRCVRGKVVVVRADSSVRFKSVTVQCAGRIGMILIAVAVVARFGSVQLVDKCIMAIVTARARCSSGIISSVACFAEV